MPRRPPPSKAPRKPLPEEMAKDAIAHEEAVGSDKVRMTFRVILGREQPGPSGRPEPPPTWRSRTARAICSS